jgi:hypothetical protein
MGNSKNYVNTTFEQLTALRSTETLAADIPLRTVLIGKLTEVSPKDNRGICSDTRSSFAMESLTDKTSDGRVV